MNKLISAICSSLLLGVSLTTVHAQEFDRGIVLNTFIPKGQWVVGNSISYSEYSNDNYQFLVVENMDGIGYTFKVSPMFCYIVKDNLGLGGRFAYERSLTKLDNGDKKGNLIWENDIIAYPPGVILPIKFGKCKENLSPRTLLGFYLDCDGVYGNQFVTINHFNESLDVESLCNVEVVGNIFDNPGVMMNAGHIR